MLAMIRWASGPTCSSEIGALTGSEAPWGYSPFGVLAVGGIAEDGSAVADVGCACVTGYVRPHVPAAGGHACAKPRYRCLLPLLSKDPATAESRLCLVYLTAECSERSCCRIVLTRLCWENLPDSGTRPAPHFAPPVPKPGITGLPVAKS